ncbi:hypothetical protein CUMW_259970 [Citrus unshiu]|uniref:Uncharacterized protein n=1 Tax=Citrus unshiu TaxID=55188 RepID=A0A2H5QTD7_CITUN|nr:hypothetical protein CUMW_259970 [Citrus unshiu]
MIVKRLQIHQTDPATVNTHPRVRGWSFKLNLYLVGTIMLCRSCRRSRGRTRPVAGLSSSGVPMGESELVKEG